MKRSDGRFYAARRTDWAARDNTFHAKQDLGRRTKSRVSPRRARHRKKLTGFPFLHGNRGGNKRQVENGCRSVSDPDRGGLRYRRVEVVVMVLVRREAEEEKRS